MRKKHIYGTFAVSWTFLVAILSLFSLPDTISNTEFIPHSDKITHIIFYNVMTLAWFFYFKTTKTKYKQIIAISIAALIYGIIIEIIQAILPYGRTAEWLDGIANAIGVTLAILLLYTLPLKSKSLK
ncbi:VanZ family protein [Leptobacterium sp. I13]|uniref:VanZ family protein n=1 Tax=Leptobacterium meishanense TaxID=3128904 RepID=UPI0030EF8043